MKIEDLTEFIIYRNALKNLIKRLDSDIISIDTSYSLESKNISIMFNRKEKINIKL